MNTRPDTTFRPTSQDAYHRRMGSSQAATSKAIRWGTVPTPVGDLLVATSLRGIAVAEFVDEPALAPQRLHHRLPSAQLSATLPADDPALTAVRAMVIDGTPAQVLVDASGTEFQQRVWSALLDIPVGQTRTYSEVAAAIGHPRAVRAVASACARNPVAVAVPCHRVVRSDGSLGGYAYGLPIKEHLLAVERRRAVAAA